MPDKTVKLDHLTLDAQNALLIAKQAAMQRHSPYVDVEHVLLGLLQTHSEMLDGIFKTIPREPLIEGLTAQIGMVRDEPLNEVEGFTKELITLVDDATQEARYMGQRFVNGGHLLLGMFKAKSEPVAVTLRDGRISEEFVRLYVDTHSGEAPKAKENTEYIIQFTRAKDRAKPKQRSFSTPAAIPRWAPYVGAALLGITVYLIIAKPEALLSFWIILGGWLFSLTLHEFSHALVAYWGGDYTVKDKGYLTFNLLRYTHPLLSFGIPIFFLLIGGIGLPGGCVYINKHLLRSKWWDTAVSLAGPASNALLAVILSAPFWLGILEPTWIVEDGFRRFTRFESALAFLITLQIMSVFFNLLPIPPLDGFQAIAPFLPPRFVQQMFAFGMLSLFLIFYLFRIPAINNYFWNQVYSVDETLQVPPEMSDTGYYDFRFWDN